MTYLANLATIVKGSSAVREQNYRNPSPQETAPGKMVSSTFQMSQKDVMNMWIAQMVLGSQVFARLESCGLQQLWLALSLLNQEGRSVCRLLSRTGNLYALQHRDPSGLETMTD